MSRNSEIKDLMRAFDLKQWQVAEKCGFSESYLSRVLRYELKPQLKERIINSIYELHEGKEK